LLPLQRQGETIALAPGGGRLLVGSEGVHSTVRAVDVPPAAAVPTTRTTAPATGTVTSPPAGVAAVSPTAVPPTAASATTASATSARPGSPPVSTRQVVWGASASVGLVAFALLSTWLARRAAGGHR
jgi:hypothetical protein